MNGDYGGARIYTRFEASFFFLTFSEILEAHSYLLSIIQSFSDFMAKRSVVTGISLFTATPEETQETKSMIRRNLSEGRFNVVVGKTYKLGDAAQAHIDIMSDAGSKGKLILRPFEE